MKSRYNIFWQIIISLQNQRFSGQFSAYWPFARWSNVQCECLFLFFEVCSVLVGHFACPLSNFNCLCVCNRSHTPSTLLAAAIDVDVDVASAFTAYTTLTAIYLERIQYLKWPKHHSQSKNKDYNNNNNNNNNCNNNNPFHRGSNKNEAELSANRAGMFSIWPGSFPNQLIHALELLKFIS